MPRSYFVAASKTIARKGVKILIGVALIYGALYSLVWVTEPFISLKPGESPLLTPNQLRMTALSLSGIYSFLVLAGRI
jgi:hypothetical protein